MSKTESGADTQKDLVAALGRIPSGLFVITVRHGEAETGMLGSWVQQCSFEPLQISLAIRPDREVVPWLTKGARFTVNIIGEGQNALLSHFGKGFRLDEPAFEGLAVTRPEGNPPVLVDALAYLVCEVVEHYSPGDHLLFIGRVVAGRMQGEGRPRTHVRSNGLRY